MLKDNVAEFGRDVAQNGGYRYTTNAPYSAQVANRRLTEVTLAYLDPRKDLKILDVGCGDGTYTAELSYHYPHSVWGVDPSQEAILLAREKHGRYAQFLIDDATDLAHWNPSFFDVAVVRGVLHHTANPPAVLRSLAHVARKVLVLEPNGNNPVLKAIEKLSPYHRAHEERSFRPREIERWCAAAGFEVERTSYAGFVPFFCPAPIAMALHAAQGMLEKTPVIREVFSAVSVISARRR
jgi:SAM-dependent methyltransferase